MFRRRNKKKPHDVVREFLWPSMGWRRLALYLTHRLRRLPDSPASIAAGFCCGMAVSFTPFLGLHFVLAALLAWVLNGNIFASAVGTIVGNPWTFPLIWISSYRVGSWLLGYDDGTLPVELTFSYLVDHTWQVFMPMLLGGTILGVIVWLACFLPLRTTVAAYQNLRRRRR